MAEVIRLSNGLRICYERKIQTLACAVGVYVNVGSANEEAKENGVAHYIEHMTFKGTQTRTAFQLADESDRMGADNNAFTSKENTVFYYRGLNKFAERYIELLGDMLFCSLFDEKETERERGVILEEIHMYDDDADSLCSDLLAKVYYGKDSAFSRPILGTEKTVKKIMRENLISFHDKWYRPENMVVCFVGSEPKENVISYVEKHMVEKMPRFDKPFTPLIFPEDKPNVGYKTLTKPFEQASVIIRFPSFPYSRERKYQVLHLSEMLGGSMSSKLFQKVREELGLAYEISSTVQTRKTGGQFDIEFATSPKTVEQATKAVKNVLEEILSKGFEEKELEKTKVQLETSMVLADESAFSKMRVLGKSLINYDILFDIREQIEDSNRVSMREIKEVAESIFAQTPTVSYVGKKIDCDLLRLFEQGDTKQGT